MLVTGIAVGTVTAMLGAALISLGMGLKARMEEGFLTAELGDGMDRIAGAFRAHSIPPRIDGTEPSAYLRTAARLPRRVSPRSCTGLPVS